MFGGSFKTIVRNPENVICWNFTSKEIIGSGLEKFQMDLDNLFDIAHADAFERMKIKIKCSYTDRVNQVVRVAWRG